jgi:hypothetical protein
MADYYSILAQAVGALDPSTADARGQLYDRARSAMISKLEGAVPPFDGADVAAARIAFESAVARVEAEAVVRDGASAAAVGAPPLSPDKEAGGTRIERRATSSGASARETWLTDLLERPRMEPTMARATLPSELEAPTLRQGRRAGRPFLHPASRLIARTWAPQANCRRASGCPASVNTSEAYF